MIIIALSRFNLAAQISFEKYFLDKTLRIDYLHTGNSNEESVKLHQIKEDPYWGGSKKNLIDNFNYGKYKFTITDSVSGKLLYSRGYSTLFSEWQTTEESKRIIKTFDESIDFPYPMATIKVLILSRDKQDEFNEIFSAFINPQNCIFTENPQLGLKTIKIHHTGNHHDKLDIVILPEGYIKKEMKKFKKDARRVIQNLLDSSPYNVHKDRINIWAVKAISIESGTDIPGDSIWKESKLNTSFYTFGNERYLTTLSYHLVKDVAANVPHDQIYILVNSSKYGGGGIYNFYSIGISDNEATSFIFCHEFAHAFAGLADEYYNSEVAYEDFYSLDIEPWEPNITTLINFEKKWKEMILSDTPFPTLRVEQNSNKIGVFEGGGYVAKGVYSPFMDCTMKSAIWDNFCPVCKKAIVKMLESYSN